MKDWHRGMEIVCVNKEPILGVGGPNLAKLELGKVYKIRDFDVHGPFVIMDIILGPGLYLEEIHLDRSMSTGKEYSYYAWRFKPVLKSKKEEDISIFQKILDEVNVREKEKVGWIGLWSNLS